MNHVFDYNKRIVTVQLKSFLRQLQLQYIARCNQTVYRHVLHVLQPAGLGSARLGSGSNVSRFFFYLNANVSILLIIISQIITSLFNETDDTF